MHVWHFSLTRCFLLTTALLSMGFPFRFAILLENAGLILHNIESQGGPPPRVPIVGPPSKGRKIVLAFTKGSAKRNKRGVFVRFWGRPQVRWAHTRAQERPPPWSPTSPRTPQPLLKGSQTDSRKKGVSSLLYYYTWLQVDWGAAEFRSQRS